MSRNIITLLPCHLCSQRVPFKPLRKLVNGDSLIVNALKQLKRLESVLNPYLSCWPGDVLLTRAAVEIGIPIIPMTYKQSRSEQWEEISEAWVDVRADWIYEVNIICHPFVKDSTLLRGLEAAKHCNYPFISAVEQRNLFWDYEWQPLLHIDGPVNTKTAPGLLSATHMMYGWQPSDCGKGRSERITNFKPFVIDYDPIELIDIDNLNDLELAKRIICK